jgi:hypothetical protein
LRHVGGLFGTGYIDFAVSPAADPTGTWNHGFFYWTDQIPDDPAPGTSTDKVAFASNLYSMTQAETSPGAGDCLTGATLDQGDIVDMDWADLTNGGAFDAVELGLDTGSFGPRVAVQVPETSPALQQVLSRRGGSLRGDLLHGRRDRRRDAHYGSSGTSRYRHPAPWIDPPQPVQDGRTRSTRPSTAARPTRCGKPTGWSPCPYPCGTGPRLRPGH